MLGICGPGAERRVILHLVSGHTRRLHFPVCVVATLSIPLDSGHETPTLTFDTVLFSLFCDSP